MAKNETLREENPVLFVGLGGTGKQVMLNLRRQFMDKYGSATLPHIGHLWIDTDSRNITLDGERLGEVYKEVYFKGSEHVETPLSKSELSKRYNDPKAYPEIFSWFDPELMNLGEIENGAAQIRPFGRLAFFIHYNKILSALRETVSRLTGSDTVNTLRDKYNIALNTRNLDVQFVFSVAGGTGSGMFLDMANLVKRELQNAKIESVILLPSVFSNQPDHKIFANSYAALKELEYYNYSSDSEGNTETSETNLAKFRIQWTKDLYEKEIYSRPPIFQNSWLIGNKSRSSSSSVLSIDEKRYLCEMIAEKFFIQYSNEQSALANEIDSHQSNNKNYLDDVATLMPPESRDRSFSQRFARRYSSFGLSKLYVPVGRLERTLHHRMGQDITSAWLMDGNIPASFPRDLDREHGDAIGYNQNARPFVEQLSAEGATNFSVQIKAALDEKCEEFKRKGLSEQSGAVVRDWFENTFLSGHLNDNTTVKSKMGFISRFLKDEQEQVYRRSLLAIDDAMRGYLGTPGQGFKMAQHALAEFVNRFTRCSKQHGQMIRQFSQQRDVNGRKAQALLGWVGEYSGNFTRKAIIDVAFEYLERQSQAEFRRQRSQAIKIICDRLIEQIGSGEVRDTKDGEVTIRNGLVKELADIKESVEGVRLRLKEREEELKAKRVSPLNYALVSYDEEVIQAYYRMNNEPVNEDNINNLASDFFGVDAPARSLWDLRVNNDETQRTEVLRGLLKYAARKIQPLDDDIVDVLKAWQGTRRASGSEGTMVDSVIDRVMFNGMPWQDIAKHETREGDWGTTSPSRIASFISIPTNSDVNTIRTFKKQITDNVQEFRPQFVDGSGAAVYFYSEIPGLPLITIPRIDEYKTKAYEPRMDITNAGPTRVLHIELDYDKYPDLLSRSSGEIDDLMAAYRLFTLASLLGLLSVKQNKLGGQPAWSFEFKEKFKTHKHKLGKFSDAIEELKKSESPKFRHMSSLVAYRLNTASAMDLTKLILLSVHLSESDAPMSRELHSALNELQVELSGLIKDSEVTQAEIRDLNSRIEQWSEPLDGSSIFRRLKT